MFWIKGLSSVQTCGRKCELTGTKCDHPLRCENRRRDIAPQKKLGHARYPSPALRAPSPLRGERDGVRGPFGRGSQHFWKLLRNHRATKPNDCLRKTENRIEA